MNALALLLLALPPAADLYPHLPPLADAARFPAGHIAATQYDRWREHLLKLQEAEPWYHPWPLERRRLARWIEETREAIAFWEALLTAQNRLAYAPSPSSQELLRREALAALRKRLGEDRYRAGWHPFLLPPKLWK